MPAIAKNMLERLNGYRRALFKYTIEIERNLDPRIENDLQRDEPVLRRNVSFPSSTKTATVIYVRSTMQTKTTRSKTFRF